MTTGGIVHELRRRGIQLEVSGDRLRYFPRSAVGPELVERLKSRKVEIVAYLTDNTTAASETQQSLQKGSGQGVLSEVMSALRQCTVDWSDPDTREERLAIILDGCGIDPAVEFDWRMLLRPQPDP